VDADVRRSRRLGIAVRLVLYPMALGLIALAWQEYHGSPPQAHAIVHFDQWRGTTAQGEEMTATTRQGLLLGFATRLVERCSDGSTFTLRWYPSMHRFVQHGESLRGGVSEPGLEARVWARIGAEPNGTLRAKEAWTTRDGRVVRCDSGRVRFTLRRAP
jgi:hypothetical protein